MQNKKQTYYLIIISVLLFLISGCSASAPAPKEKSYHNLDEGLKVLVAGINEVIINGVKAGSIPALLNVAVLDIEEKSTGATLAFGSHIAEKLVLGTTSQLPKEHSTNIGFINLERIREILKGAKEKKISSKDLALELDSNMMIKGTFLQENENHLILKIEMLNPREGLTYQTFEVGILVESIAKQWSQSFPLFVEKDFKTLYQKIGQTKAENVAALVHDQWNQYYTPNQKKLLIEKITALFSTNIQNLADDNATAGDRLGTVKKIALEKKNSEFYLKESFLFQELQYTYVLTAKQKRQVKESLGYIQDIEFLFTDGIPVSLSFVAQTDDNDPLDFECSGDKELTISLGGRNFNYKEASCTVEGERQVMTWLTSFILSPKNWPITVVEENVLGDEVLKSNISVSKDQLLNIYFKSDFEISLTGYDYYLARFTKQD
ncbi:MAG: hypothetical protein GY786_02020 [Proteobacteria bacterium]|nr:hypothetical protein [Pseudomonadota bacterium]